MNDNILTWKFSLSKYHKIANTAYDYCSDTSCKGKGYNTFKIEEVKLLYETLIYENFKISNAHSIPYKEHEYILNKIILKDYDDLSKKTSIANI